MQEAGKTDVSSAEKWGLCRIREISFLMWFASAEVTTFLSMVDVWEVRDYVSHRYRQLFPTVVSARPTTRDPKFHVSDFPLADIPGRILLD